MGQTVQFHLHGITVCFLFLQTSEYPVILSLENHCSVDQQKLMAHHLISILGDALVTKPTGYTVPMNFPSPEVCERLHHILDIQYFHFGDFEDGMTFLKFLPFICQQWESKCPMERQCC